MGSTDPPQDATTVEARLFAVVERYAAMGFHRTGSTIDEATAYWMADELRARGLRVEVEPVAFDRWISTSSLTLDGAEIFHLAVPYEWTGSLDTDRVAVIDFDARHGGFMDVLVEPVAQARAEGAEAVVVATRHPQGSLVAVNRDPTTSLGFPVVLVAGRDLTRLATGSPRLQMIASTTPGTTFNVVATNASASAADADGVGGAAGAGNGASAGIGATKADELLLTTPLTGWFTCAGERATGIAVLLELVARLRDLPLRIVATGGHELDFLAAKRWVEANRHHVPAAIFHVGASVAVVEPNSADGSNAGNARPLATTRLALTNLGSDAASDITTAMGPAGLNLTCDADTFIGEGATFSAIDAPLLSTTGAGLDFHTPEDLPHRATTPEALTAVADAFTAAARALYAAAGRGTVNRH